RGRPADDALLRRAAQLHPARRHQHGDRHTGGGDLLLPRHCRRLRRRRRQRRLPAHRGGAAERLPPPLGMDTAMDRDIVRSSARFGRRTGIAAAGAALALLVTGPALAEVAQTPLYLGGGNVPGNLVLVPSVEWPTINSVANLGEYDPDRTYVGYFDPNKCYAYSYSGTEANRHFYPVGPATKHECSGYWSGNFMNWAATQT